MTNNDAEQKVTPLPKRHSVRMPGFDYARSAKYFVTICCVERTNRLGFVAPMDGSVDEWCAKHNALGQIVIEEINNIPARLHDVTVDGFIVMPDHVHIMISNDKEGSNQLKNIIGGLKSIITNRYIKLCKQTGELYAPLWQRNYYDHIIRDREEFYNIMEYMYKNPIRWAAKHNLITIR